MPQRALFRIYCTWVWSNAHTVDEVPIQVISSLMLFHNYSEYRLSKSFGQMSERSRLNLSNKATQGSYSEDSIWIDAAVQPRYMNLTSSCPVKRSKNRHFCPMFDVIGQRVWAALASKVAKIQIRFWCMLMLGLGPIWLRPSPAYTPLWTSARASDYCCRPRIDRLLY